MLIASSASPATHQPDINAPGLAPLEDRPLKHSARLKEIRPRMVATKSVELLTSVAARHLRRDFNIASAKMYVFSLDPDYKKRIHEALGDVEWEIATLEAESFQFSHFPTGHLRPLRYEMFFVSAESARMFRALKSADLSFARFYAAEFAGFLDKETRQSMTRPFFLAYSVFKRVAMKLQAKSVDEMLAELKLS